ncbi:MAG: Rpn family recombination-promoting nuclease/putative transposase [Candidatus Rhabdochlamydia sp.]
MNILKYLDPKNDAAFKRVFGSEQNKDILIHFLNDVLGSFRESPIVEIDFLPTILQPENREQKTSLVDVLCKDANGTKYIIEMQSSSTKDFEKRAQHYAAKVYGNQARMGRDYQDLKEIIFLAIADYVIFPNKDHYKSDHIVLDTKTYEHDLKDFFFTFIELPKFKKNKEELFSLEDKWCYFFKHAQETTEEDLEKIVGKDSIILKAYKALDQFYWTQGELTEYDAIQISEMNKRADSAALNQQMDEAIAKGLDEGLSKGKIEGKMEMAKNLLQKGIEIDVIAQCSDLSKEQIEELKKYIFNENSVVNF